MYLAFQEEQAEQIRECGLSVIEFKNRIRKGISMLSCGIREAIRIITEMITTLTSKICEIVDDVKFHIEDFLVRCGYPASKRYKFVRLMDNWGLDKYEVWRKTRHTWLARSNC